MEEFKRYRPKLYTVELQIGPNSGDNVTGSITVSTRPFVLRNLKHQIINDGLAPIPVVQDGLYKIDWSISEVNRFFAGPAPMADFYGSVRTGEWRDFDPPLEIRETLVISVRVINVLGPRPFPITVQIGFDGYELHDQSSFATHEKG